MLLLLVILLLLMMILMMLLLMKLLLLLLLMMTLLMLLLQVCRTAGYFEHALFVAQAAAETEWYLDILLEDLHAWEDALAYLQDLARQQAAAALKKHGKVWHTLYFYCLICSRSSSAGTGRAA